GHDAATRINRACARCHQVLFSGYPSTWEGGARKDHSGGSTINSGEARDFLLGGCASAMSCGDCHHPHSEDGSAGSHDLELISGNKVCVRCHELQGRSLTAHTHHSATSDGSVCVRCHMPRKNVALDGTLGPYHRIGSPNDRARVEHDRPLECALCHADADVKSLVDTMEHWWGKTFDRGALVALYGRLDAKVLRATLTLGKPHEQAVAIFTLGMKRDRASAAAIGAQTISSIPLVRYYARDALARILEEPSPIDLHQDNKSIRAATDAWLRAHAIDPERVGPIAGAKDDGDAEE
ncbi:MAG: hypothetical protein ACHREM_02540, partial [Polyangiales bacterium]